MIEKLPETPEIKAGKEVAMKLQRQGHSAYFVGGVVRDLLLGKPAKEIDLVTSALPDEILKIFPHNHPIGAAFGIITVIENGIPFEVATFREEREYLDGRHPEEVSYTTDPSVDAARRDFTINGMFYDPVAGELIDTVGGQDDLRRGVLRTIGDARERFNEDWLRMLRAVRFGVRFQLEVDPEIPAAIQKLAGKVSELAVERVTEELNKMFLGPFPERALEMLNGYGLLKPLLPEIAAMNGVSQPEAWHPEGDVFEHTVLMLKHMVKPSVVLAWSILLHDVGKPLAKTVDEEGGEHFYSHEKNGAEMSETILKRLRFSGKQVDTIIHAVRNHMRFAHVHQMRTAKWKRLMAEPDFLLELELHRIDCISSNELMDNYLFLIDRSREVEDEIALPKPLITGKDLLRMGMKPGPKIGKILKTVTDLHLEGKISTREEALGVAKEKLDT